MDISLFFAQLWGSFFVIFGALFIITRQLGKTIELTENRAFVISTGYITLLMGLVTVILHNVWVADWRVVITILGWATVVKGIMKIGFPEHIHAQAQRFKTKQLLSAVLLLGVGMWLLVGAWYVGQDQSVPPLSEPAVEITTNEFPEGRTGLACQTHAECPIPMSYAVQSICPFESACVDGECVVACPMWEHREPAAQQSVSYAVSCQQASDCDCARWDEGGRYDCACVDGRCASIVAP